MSLIARDRSTQSPARRHQPGSVVAKAIASQAGARTSTAAPASWIEIIASRLSPHEWRRRLVHMTPGVMAAVLPLLPHTDPLAWYSQWFLVVVIGATALYSI